MRSSKEPSPNSERENRRARPAQRRPDPPPAAKPRRSRSGSLASDRVAFAHESEREYARLLDFYQIAWEYEPRTFDIEWDAAGNATQRFAPDFYLPEFDLYIEVTTLNQKLVTKKNRKIRRLRELHPEIKVKIFYQRDYRRLLDKYGLTDETSGGTSGGTSRRASAAPGATAAQRPSGGAAKEGRLARKRQRDQRRARP